MKGSGIFTAQRSTRRVADVDRAARHDPQLALGDDHLAGRKALRDNSLHPDRALDGHGPQLGGAVRLDDVDVLSGLRSLEGAGGDRDHLGVGEGQCYGYELPGPEALRGIGKGGLEPQGTGRGLDGVIEKGELPGFRLLVRPRWGGSDGELAGRAVALEGSKVLLGHSEGDVDRAQLMDGGEGRAGVIAAHDVALVEGDLAGPAGEGGADRAVLELDPGGGEP